MINFPGGDNFTTFLRTSGMRSDSDRIVFSELGAKSFWFLTQSDANNFWINIDCHITRSYKAGGLYGDWDEIIDLRGIGDVAYQPRMVVDTVPIIKGKGRGKNSKAGIWDFYNGTEHELYEKLAKFDTVILYVNVPHKSWFKSYHTRYAEKLRWVVTAREQFPNSRILSCGSNVFELQYCMGLDGTLSNFIPSAGRYSTIFRPNGAAEVIEIFAGKPINKPSEFMKEWEYLLHEFPDKRWAFYYYKMLLMIPDYVKWFYSRERMVPLQVASSSDFSELDWYFGRFVENPRRVGLPEKGEDDVRRDKNGRIYGRNSNISGGMKLTVDLYRRNFIYNDAVFCDSCSLNYGCLLYVEGGACRVPSSEGVKFSKKFSSSNAQDILNGMGELLEKRAILVASRLDKHEADETEPTKEDVALMNGLFKDGATLAKLRDPSLTRPQVVVGVNNQIEAGGQQKQITDRDYSNAIREIESTGIHRDQITNEMIENYISQSEGSYRNQPQLSPSFDLPPETEEKKSKFDKVDIDGVVVENDYIAPTDVEDVF